MAALAIFVGLCLPIGFAALVGYLVGREHGARRTHALWKARIDPQVAELQARDDRFELGLRELEARAEAMGIPPPPSRRPRPIRGLS